LAEEHQRIDPLKDLLKVSEEIKPQERGRAVVKTAVASQNEQSYTMLEGMMKGAETRRGKAAPVMKRRPRK
jgi:hypothetical protein